MNRDVAQSAASSGSFVPTGPQAQLRPRGAGPQMGWVFYVDQWGLAPGLGGGAKCAAQGRAAEAPMSVRRVRGRLVRETLLRGWWPL